MEKTSVFLILLLVLVTFPCSCRSVHPTTPEKQEKPTVAVVHILEELRKQPLIKLPNGVTIKLGISDNQSYIGGGILLYCLATGAEPPLEETENRWRLGPIAYEVTHPWETGKAKKLRAGYYASAGGWAKKGEVLFCALVQTPDPGDYRIHHVTLDGRSLAFATITAKKQDPHPWQPAGLLWENKQWTLFNDPNPGAALPGLVGLSGKSNPEKLPHLPLGNNVVETGDFNIALDGTNLFLTFAHPVVYTPEFPLLCRWWVNGKPIVPPVLTETPGREITGLVQRAKKILVKLRVDGEKLGAKPGDIIGLQILYTSTGWRYASPPGFADVTLGHPYAKPGFMLSNRINFKYEGK
jgi:hypothetical protein